MTWVGIAVVGGAVIGGGASILSSKMSSKAAKSAAETQAEAAGQATEAQTEDIDKAIAFQREMLEIQREDFAPFREIGLESLETLQPLVEPGGDLVRGFTMDDFQADPGYQFRLEEGTKALDRSAASRGKLFSGAQLRDLARFNQNLASEEYGQAFNRFGIEQGNKFNRLGAMANIGERATMTLADLGSRTAGNVGNLQTQRGRARATGYINAGNAQAAGTVGQANAYNQMLGNVGNAANQGINNYMLWQMARSPYSPASGAQPILLN